MTRHATIIRYNKGLEEADAKIVELQDRFRNVNLADKSQWANTSLRVRAAALEHAGAEPRGGAGSEASR